MLSKAESYNMSQLSSTMRGLSRIFGESAEFDDENRQMLAEYIESKLQK